MRRWTRERPQWTHSSSIATEAPTACTPNPGPWRGRGCGPCRISSALVQVAATKSTRGHDHETENVDLVRSRGADIVLDYKSIDQGRDGLRRSRARKRQGRRIT